MRAKLNIDSALVANVSLTDKWSGFLTFVRRLGGYLPLSQRHRVNSDIPFFFSYNVSTRALRGFSGRGTVPQVFFGGEHVGGADDLEKYLASHKQ